MAKHYTYSNVSKHNARVVKCACGFHTAATKPHFELAVEWMAEHIDTHNQRKEKHGAKTQPENVCD